MKNYTEKEVYEIVEKIMERPDDVIDFLQNENSQHDIQSMIDNAIHQSNNRKFKTVEINETHVGVFGVYFTSSGDITYGTVWLEQSTCLWQCDLFGHKTYVTHALQEELD